MVLLNWEITWLEETHLTYQFIKTFLNRTWQGMLNLWDMFFHGEVSPKYLGKFDINISLVFIRLILPIFFFEGVSCTKNVWKKLNMNDNNEKTSWSRKLPLNYRKMFI